MINTKLKILDQQKILLAAMVLSVNFGSSNLLAMPGQVASFGASQVNGFGDGFNAARFLDASVTVQLNPLQLARVGRMVKNLQVPHVLFVCLHRAHLQVLEYPDVSIVCVVNAMIAAGQANPDQAVMQAAFDIFDADKRWCTLSLIQCCAVGSLVNALCLCVVVLLALMSSDRSCRCSERVWRLRR